MQDVCDCMGLMTIFFSNLLSSWHSAFFPYFVCCPHVDM
jgi:hypothetical protein